MKKQDQNKNELTTNQKIMLVISITILMSLLSLCITWIGFKYF